MNRDTLYSSALVDLSESASVTLPDAGDRYRSLMVVDEDHYINAVYHHPGTCSLSMDELGTRFVALVMRTFVDPSDPDDIAMVNTLEDAATIEANASGPYVHPDYDETGRKATFDALVKLGEGLPDTRRMFGRKDEVDPVRHLVGTATGWGGLPKAEAFYVIETEPRPVGRYTRRQQPMARPSTVPGLCRRSCRSARPSTDDIRRRIDQQPQATSAGRGPGTLGR